MFAGLAIADAVTAIVGRLLSPPAPNQDLRPLKS